MTTTNWTRLENAVNEAPFQIGVSLSTLDGVSWGYRSDTLCQAASVIKIMIMVEIMHLVDAGLRNLTDMHVIKSDDKTPGSGVLLDLHDGLELTLQDMLHLMMVISDNTATNLLIDFAGIDAINRRMSEWGITGSVLNRKMQGHPAGPGQKENFLVPCECSRLLRMLLAGEAASSQSCEFMVGLLRKQRNRRRLARPLNGKHEHIEFGGKPGTIKGVCNDAGFFRTGERTIILSVFLERVTDNHAAEATIGGIARAALEDAGFL